MRDPLNSRQPSTDAFQIARHRPTTGNTRFFVPPTLESDFKAWQMTDVPHVNYTFELVRDWYRIGEPGYIPEYLRASYFPINWKSKLGNSDVNSNFKTHHGIDIRKGDILIREDGAIYMLNWAIQAHPNNQSTQAIVSNAYLVFTRHAGEVLDARGLLIEEARDVVIAPTIPCVYAEYAGRPDYSANFNAPGIAADDLLTVQVQYNSTTEKIRINDEFSLLHYRYRIVNLIGNEVDIDRKYGIINLMARRIAGDEANEWRV